ncbi:YifB family Mg chelatase-like AAA ATPase [Candidatus Saccharibacteria bacterium]|nr:YifB family Mg chelatase-like AAA ATPase [Candidatus Saccharibacteria bacterium]
MIAKVYSIVPFGFSGALVEVEGDKNHGLPAFNIVGMANKTINEARDRVRSALVNSSFSFPCDKITINLAPADLQKDGTYLDLPIALSVLLLSEQLLPKDVEGRIFVGELSLEGSLRPIHGIINIIESAKKLGFKEVFLPMENLPQASLISGIKLVGVSSLLELFSILKHQTLPSSPVKTVVKRTGTPTSSISLNGIKGQELAKRALSIAVAGHHNILISGPPGAGKTLLARAAVNLLPPLTPAEQIPLTKLYSLLSSDCGVIDSRPFRCPHHSASSVSILGGGSTVTPGEISLAHLGVLFLDELPEYPRSVLESLRQPLEDRQVTITRAKARVTYPADFMLIATMNPCPCGFYGDPTKACTCSPSEIKNYQKKLSGPLLDRIDILINVQKVPTAALSLHGEASSTDEQEVVKNKISGAINRQHARYHTPYVSNSSLSSAETAKFIHLAPSAESLLRSAAEHLELSARSFFKTIKVAQTIADYENQDVIQPEHISEALSYRLDQTKDSFIISGKPKKTLAMSPKI